MPLLQQAASQLADQAMTLAPGYEGPYPTMPEWMQPKTFDPTAPPPQPIGPPGSAQLPTTVTAPSNPIPGPQGEGGGNLLADLYVPPQQVAQATAADATASGTTAGTMDAAQAGAVGYGAEKGAVTPDSMVKHQLLDITRQSSPLMERARQSGILSAAKRGLQNTSLAAGSVMGAMVDKATPIAMQDAATQWEQQKMNQGFTQEAGLFTAEQYNAVAVKNTEMLNAARALNLTEANRASMFNAEMQTQIAEANAARKTAVSQGNAQEVNRMSGFILEMNTELNKQFLAGQQAMDLADIQGRYQQLISTNASAAVMWNAYFDSIAGAMANKDITPQRVAAYVDVQQKMLESGLNMLDTINSVDLSSWSGMPSVSSPSANQIIARPPGYVAPPAPTYGGYNFPWGGGWPF